MRKKRPPWLHGYPSHLALLAAHVLNNEVDLGYQIDWITIGAESLLEQQADLMEKAFGLRPRQHYGMAEAVANISECHRGSLHVDEDFSAVEFVPHPHGWGHKIIGTNFTNPAMPLLRYDVQDMVALDENSCPCGHPGRVVLSIDGRQEDYVILPNGSRIGRMDHIFKDMTSIREAQISQREIGQIIIRVVKTKHYTPKDEIALRREAAKRVGADTEVKIEYVEAIKRTGAGKLRFVVSEIPEGQLAKVGP
jgi:phenylacetate-CoA ligase